MDRVRIEPRSEQARCPYCHEVVAPADEKAPCLSCMAWHHRACRDEHPACAACGVTEGAGETRPHPPAAPPSLPGLLRAAAAEAASWPKEDLGPAPGPAPTPVGALAVVYYLLMLIAVATLMHLILG